MEDEIFEKYFAKLRIPFSYLADYYIEEDEVKAKKEIKQILEEIYKLGYQQCETDISNDDRYSLREDFEKGNI